MEPLMPLIFKILLLIIFMSRYIFFFSEVQELFQIFFFIRFSYKEKPAKKIINTNHSKCVECQ